VFINIKEVSLLTYIIFEAFQIIIFSAVSLLLQNKKPERTLESAQYRLEIIINIDFLPNEIMECKLIISTSKE